MYDAIILGARVAGSATGKPLARMGFPSGTLSTHYLHSRGMAKLQRWGLREALAATGCPPVRDAALDFGAIVPPAKVAEIMAGSYVAGSAS